MEFLFTLVVTSRACLAIGEERYKGSSVKDDGVRSIWRYRDKAVRV